jgi:hypothetical protein
MDKCIIFLFIFIRKKAQSGQRQEIPKRLPLSACGLEHIMFKILKEKYLERKYFSTTN